MNEQIIGTTLIASDDSWSIWAIILVIVAVSVILEKKFKWAKNISAALICILLGILTTSVNILPTESAVYDSIATFCIPVSVCILLFNANIKEIIKKSGSMMITFHICVVGAMLGGTGYCLLLRKVMPEADKLAAGELASMIGSTSNAVVVYDTVGLTNTSFATMLVVGNFVFAVVMMALMGLPRNSLIKKLFPHPYEDVLESNQSTANLEYESNKKEVKLHDIAIIIGIAFAVVAVASKISGLFRTAFETSEGAGVVAQLPSMILGNQFIITTVIATTLVTVFPKFFDKLNGAQDIGTYIIFIYFVTIGTGANLLDVLINAPMLFLIMLSPNIIFLAFILIVGKVMKVNIEELTISAIASLGGPSTAAGAAGSKGYDKLVVPGLLVGIWGNVIGSIIGLLMYALFSYI